MQPMQRARTRARAAAAPSVLARPPALSLWHHQPHCAPRQRQRLVRARAAPRDDDDDGDDAARRAPAAPPPAADDDRASTRLARLAAEAVASPIFYLFAGLVAVKLVASTGEQAPAILAFAALPVTALTALSRSPLGAAVQASLEARLPELEAASAERRRAAAEARRASPFFGARRPLLPSALGGGRAPWLDGTLAGDYGFDPLGLSAPDRAPLVLPSLFGGGGGGAAAAAAAAAAPGPAATAAAASGAAKTPPPSRTDALAPPPGTNAPLARMAEAELLHARWAMLGALGCLVPEALQLLAHVDVGPEARWWAVGGAKLHGDFDIEWGGIRGLHIAGRQGVGVIAAAQAFLMGGPEYARRVGIRSLEPVGVYLPGDGNYPGGAPFDPLGLADDGARFARLATSEVRHGRLAMVAFLGYAAQAAATRKGPVENLLDACGVVVGPGA
jgi:light-harvesting complex II chlorophyll a/b binding protein 7